MKRPQSFFRRRDNIDREHEGQDRSAKENETHLRLVPSRLRQDNSARLRKFLAIEAATSGVRVNGTSCTIAAFPLKTVGWSPALRMPDAACSPGSRRPARARPCRCRAAVRTRADCNTSNPLGSDGWESSTGRVRSGPPRLGHTPARSIPAVRLALERRVAAPGAPGERRTPPRARSSPALAPRRSERTGPVARRSTARTPPDRPPASDGDKRPGDVRCEASTSVNVPRSRRPPAVGGNHHRVLYSVKT